MKSIYVGNLPFAYNDTLLQELFAIFDEVKNEKLITDKMTVVAKASVLLKWKTMEKQ